VRSVSGLCPPKVQVARQQGRQPFPNAPWTKGFYFGNGLNVLEGKQR